MIMSFTFGATLPWQLGYLEFFHQALWARRYQSLQSVKWQRVTLLQHIVIGHVLLARVPDSQSTPQYHTTRDRQGRQSHPYWAWLNALKAFSTLLDPRCYNEPESSKFSNRSDIRFHEIVHEIIVLLLALLDEDPAWQSSAGNRRLPAIILHYLSQKNPGMIP